MDIIEALNWRYATKKMTGDCVPQDLVDKIVEAARLAPSGIGLQPYELIVISNAELKERILPVAMNQAPVVQSSHLIVFAVWDQYTTQRIDKVFDYLNQERKQSTSISESQRSFAKNYFAKFSQEENFHHAAKQANIALGLSIAAAAMLEVDATPMEGFDPKALDVVLGLAEKGLRSSMLLALGYRDEKNDWNLNLKKVRKPIDEFLTSIY